MEDTHKSKDLNLNDGIEIFNYTIEKSKPSKIRTHEEKEKLGVFNIKKTKEDSLNKEKHSKVWGASRVKYQGGNSSGFSYMEVSCDLLM